MLMKDHTMIMVKDVPTDSALIDILSDSSFAREHIEGAENFCVFEVVFLEKIQKAYPNKERSLCIYGWSDESGESARAHYLLTSAGYTHITILEGGLEKWKSDGKKIEEGEEIHQLDGVYIVDPTMSCIEWTGRNIGNKHVGTIMMRSGSLISDKGILQSGTIVLDMTTIANMDLDDAYKPQLEGHLKSDDFFSVNTFSEAVLEIVEAEKLESIASVPNYLIKAHLTVKGIKQNIDFLAFVHEKEDKIVINAHFDIDRTRWGVTYGSEQFFSRMGIHIVDDMISFDLILLGSKE